MWLFDLFIIIIFFNFVNLICRGTDISKYLRESLGLWDNESWLYMFSWRNKKNIMWIPSLIWSYDYYTKLFLLPAGINPGPGWSCTGDKNIPYLPYVFRHTGLSKQCRPRWNTTKHGVSSGSTLFAIHPAIYWTQLWVINCICSNFKTSMARSWGVWILRVNMVMKSILMIWSFTSLSTIFNPCHAE